MNSMSSGFYVTGGSLRSDTPSYVRRNADSELYDALTVGEFCYVLTSRQMGKSSLMVRTAVRLREEGVRAAVLDLTAIGQNLAAEQWYYGLLERLGEQLHLERALGDFWTNNPRLGPLQRFMAAVRVVALTDEAGTHASNLVIFMDEIDAVRSLSFSTDEFFAAIRECYNRRTEVPDFDRLTFCMMGVASPTDLIRDTRMTPFNIGRRIELDDFTDEEAAPLAGGLINHEDTKTRRKHGRSLLSRILHWTNGHPYLTQRLCLAVADHANGKSVDDLAEELFLSDNAQERDYNLIFVRDRMLRGDADLGAILELYRKVRAGKRVPNDDTNSLVSILRLSGIARVERGFLKVRNHIYERVFDRRWIQMHMPDAELQRQRAAYRRGMLRASTITLSIVVVMALLAITALSKAIQAREATKLANSRARIADREKNNATELASERKIALMEATKERNHARNETSRALMSEASERFQKRQAVQARMQAVSQKHIAEQTTEESRQRLVRLNVLAGQQLADAGDRMGALLHYIEARRLERDRTSASIHDMRIALALNQSPRLVHTWWGGGSGTMFALSGSDRAIVPPVCTGEPELFDLTTNRSVTLRIHHGAGEKPYLVSPDGNALFTVDTRNVGRVWDTHTGQSRSPSLPLHGPIKLGAMDCMCRHLITVTKDNTIELWEPFSGKCLRLNPTGFVSTIEISADGSRMAACVYLGKDKGGLAYVWETATGHPIGVLPFMQAIGRMRLDVNGKRALLINDGVLLWHPDSPSASSISLVANSRFPLQAGFSADGNRVCSYSDAAMSEIWDAETGKRIAGPIDPGGEITTQTLSQDNAKLATAGTDGIVKIWNTSTGAQVLVQLQNSGEAKTVCFSPDGKRLLVNCENGTSSLWELNPPGVSSRDFPAARDAGTDQPSDHDHTHFSPDGRLLIVRGDDFVQVRSVGTGQVDGPVLQHHHLVTYADFAHGGRWVITASEDGSARVWRTGSDREIGLPLKHGAPVTAVAETRDWKTLLTGGEDGVVRLWDTDTFMPLPDLARFKLPVRSAKFSPNGRYVAVWCGLPHSWKAFEVYLWDRVMRKCSMLPLTNVRTALDIHFSPNGRFLLTACGERAVRVWDVSMGKPMMAPLRHYDWIDNAAFSPDGTMIATGETDGQVRLWDAGTGKPRARSFKLGLETTSVCFSRDGRLLLASSANGQTMLWDARTTEEIATLRENATITYAELSPDGRNIATVSNGKVRLWTLPISVEPIERTLRLAELYSGHRLDPTYGRIPLSVPALQHLWEIVRRERKLP